MAATRQPYAMIAVPLAAASLLLAGALDGCTVPPGEAPALVTHAIALLEGEEYLLAMLTLEKALGADSTLADGWYYRGLLYTYEDETVAAESCFARAISLNGVHRQALFNRGQVRLRQGDCAGAMSDFSEIAFLYPQLPDGYRGRAWVFDRLGRIEEAIGEWGRAIGSSPNDASLYEERGCALLLVPRAESAMGDFSRALALDSTLSRSYAGRGEARYLLGLFSLALADCDAALAIDERDADAWLTRGRAADYSGQFEVAVDSYRRFLKLVPESDGDVPAVRDRLARLDR